MLCRRLQPSGPRRDGRYVYARHGVIGHSAARMFAAAAYVLAPIRSSTTSTFAVPFPKLGVALVPWVLWAGLAAYGPGQFRGECVFDHRLVGAGAAA